MGKSTESTKPVSLYRLYCFCGGLEILIFLSFGAMAALVGRLGAKCKNICCKRK